MKQFFVILKHCSLLFFGIFISFFTYAQKEDKNWYFGTGTDGIIFDSLNNPIKVSNKYQNVGYEGIVVVSDPFSGELLFYTDGIAVINKNHNIMTNGTGLLAHYSGSQCVQACRVPNTCNQYYVISNSAVDNAPGSYYYSIVDFSSNPLGAVTIKNQYINGANYHQAMCIIPKANSNNYWLIGHLYNTATYHVFEITPSGFIGPTVFNFSNSGRSWAMKFNKNTNKLLNLGQDNLKVTLFDFNTSTGTISNENQLAQPSIQAAWVGNFSLDGSKIYVGITPGNELWQYDITNSVWTDMNTCCWAHDVLTGPNGITYFMRSYNLTNPLSQILNANLTAVGNQCGYSQISNPGNFNGQVRRFPEFLVAVPPPNAVTDTITISSGSTVNILPLTNDNDPQNDPISLDSIYEGPTYGTIQILGNTIQYTSPMTCVSLIDSILYRISDSNCSYDSAYILINIIGSPTSSSFNYSIDFCTNTVTFSNTSLNSTNYIWNFGDGTTSTTLNPIHQYQTTGSFTVTLVAFNSTCSDTSSFSINIPPIVNNISSNFSYNVDSCNQVVFFVNSSLNASNYMWYFGDGDSSTLVNPQHIYNSPGIYQVTLYAYSGCYFDTTSFTINITSPIIPSSSFIIQYDTCSMTISVFNQSSNASYYLWTFGDGDSSSLSNPIHQYNASGNYTITLIALSQCESDTSTLIVNIESQFPASATFISNFDPCDSTVAFTNNSSNSNNYIWLFGDGNSDTLTSPIHTYPYAGVFYVTLVASNLCFTDSLTQTINLSTFTTPLASFSFNIQDCNSQSIQFSNTSSQAIYFLWDFGDGSYDTLANPIHNFQNAGNYNVQLIATNLCTSDTTNLIINIEPLNAPTAMFEWLLDTCNSQVTFIDKSTDAIDYLWAFGDGGLSTEQNPVYQYSGIGYYQAQLIINSSTNCPDTTMQIVLISLDSGNIDFIPNCFTPNNDGKNDTFKIDQSKSCNDLELKIYNRWGQLIYSKTSKLLEWNGKDENTEFPAGVYFYTIKSPTVAKNGSITLLR